MAQVLVNPPFSTQVQKTGDATHLRVFKALTGLTLGRGCE
jgi:hypothetical protein